MENADWEEWLRENVGEEQPATETSLVEYHPEWAPPKEEPPIIEGEFREVPIPSPPIIQEPVGETKEERKRRRGEEREVGRLRGLEKKSARLGQKIAISEQQAALEELKAVRRRERGKARPNIPKLAGRLEKLGSLGGVPMSREGRRELYFGRAGKGLYTPKAPREVLPGKEALRKVSEPEYGTLRSESTPRLGRLQEAGTLRRGPEEVGTRKTPLLQAAGGGLISTRGQGVALGLLRQMTMPKGLMPIERYAYAQLVSNSSRDTSRHVVSELAGIGISRRDAEQAIKSLLSKGLVKRTYEAPGEEPILEVTR